MTAAGAFRTVFLDAGGVLVDPDWERAAGILRGLGIAVPAAALAAADPPAKRDLDVPRTVGSTDDRARGDLFFRLVLAHAGVEAPPDRIDAASAALAAAHGESNLWSAIPDGVPEALRRLRASGRRLVVVSNADGRLAPHMERIGLAAAVDLLLDSGALGVEKPDPGIFREALRLSGAAPGEVMHVGDFYEIDVVGARAAGLEAVLVDPAGLHADRDCPRFPSLASFADALLAGSFHR